MLSGTAQLLTVFQKQQRYPEQSKTTRILSGGYRPEVDMADVYGQVWGWYPRGTPYLVHLTLDDAHNLYQHCAGNDPRSEGLTNQAISLVQASVRATSFGKQVENAYLDATRTHQEQFFNARTNEDLYHSIERDIRTSQDERLGT